MKISTETPVSLTCVPRWVILRHFTNIYLSSVNLKCSFQFSPMWIPYVKTDGCLILPYHAAILVSSVLSCSASSRVFFSLWGGNTASFSKLSKCILVVSYLAWNCGTGMYFQVLGFKERRCGCCSFSSNQFLPNQYPVNALERWVDIHTANPNEAMSAKTMDLFLTTKLQLIIGILILWVLLITLKMRNQCLQ